jgi:hypothetical protein
MATVYVVSHAETVESDSITSVNPSHDGGHIIESFHFGKDGLRVVHKLKLSTAEAARVIAKLAQQIAIKEQ